MTGGLGGYVFRGIHGHSLIYNACWEDPLIDRVALDIGPEDRLLTITSGGCNALDYALAGAARVEAVDVNPRQNFLLELKLAGIRSLDFETFFAVFGEGRFGGFAGAYGRGVRPLLSGDARAYWDRRQHWFSGSGPYGSFYFRGSAGFFARLMNLYIDRVARVREGIVELLHSGSVEEQRDIYERHVKRGFWGRMVRWMLGRDGVLALLGVPRSQRAQIEGTYPGGVVRYIEDRVEDVFARLPIRDNYFWRVYLTGGYTRECCPEYLKPENFARLKAGIAERVGVHSASVLDFLTGHDATFTRYVLLDHMDWLSAHHRPVLARQWQALFDRAAPGARAIWRSGGLRVDYVDPIRISVAGRPTLVGDVLDYDSTLAGSLHQRDRVHTYGSFYIADLKTA